MEAKKVFLDGTENGSTWREELIANIEIEYFDPSGKERSRRTLREEEAQKAESDYCLYVITPLMDDFENISELVDDSNKYPQRTLFCYLEQDQGQSFNTHQLKSLKAVGQMVEGNGATWLPDLPAVIKYLNELNKA